jgi:hypothetical protein
LPGSADKLDLILFCLGELILLMSPVQRDDHDHSCKNEQHRYEFSLSGMNSDKMVLGIYPDFFNEEPFHRLVSGKTK